MLFRIKSYIKCVRCTIKFKNFAIVKLGSDLLIRLGYER